LDATIKNDLKPCDIAHVVVGTYKTAIINSGNPSPADILQAKFSIPYCIATGIIERKLTMREFETWPPSDETLALMKKK
jgi:2-methylcitrate dehydratase PrpD